LLQQTNATGWVIDDFYANQRFFPSASLSHDEGVDAIVPFGVDTGVRAAFAASVNGGLDKLLNDCKRIRDTGHNVELLVFATTLAVRETEKRKWFDEVSRKYDWRLEVISREELISRLESPEMWCFCRDYLDLDLMDDDPKGALPAIRRATERVLGTLKRNWRFDPSMAIPLPVSFAIVDGGASPLGKTKVLKHPEIMQLLLLGERCWLKGPPGSGKTWTLLDLADRILKERNRA